MTSPSRLLGYARVSTEDQTELGQIDELKAAGCDQIYHEKGSGGDRDRPALLRMIRDARKGDTVMVVRIDRLGRSLSHLLEVIEGLRAKGVAFRSLRDPIDTGSPQGLFTLQILGAAAEFERSLIKERTKAGLLTARGQGRVGGNPGLRSKDPAALRKIARARDAAIFNKLEKNAEQWVPLVRRMRPDSAWEDVTRAVNGQLPPGSQEWTQARLIRATKRYVKDGLLSKDVLARAKPRSRDDRLMTIVASIAGANPELTLKDIATRLDRMREPTPRGRTNWQVSSVKMLLDRAKANGLLFM